MSARGQSPGGHSHGRLSAVPQRWACRRNSIRRALVVGGAAGLLLAACAPGVDVAVEERNAISDSDPGTGSDDDPATSDPSQPTDPTAGDDTDQQADPGTGT